MTSLGPIAFVGKLTYLELDPPISNITKSLPVLDNKAISENDVVMLDSTGKIFPIEASASTPFQVPIGLEHVWGLGENPQTPTATRFVGEKEFVIVYEQGFNDTNIIGGSVDTFGTFTYGTEQVVNSTINPFDISLAIDKSTYGSATVSGISISSRSAVFLTAFTYNVATKTFTFGSVVQLGTGTANTGQDIVSIGAGRYIVVTGANNAVSLLTVVGTAITVTTTLSLSTTNFDQKPTLTVIDDTKVVVLFITTTSKVGVQIVDIAGSVLTLGTTAESTYAQVNTFFTTSILSLVGKFYSTVTQAQDLQLHEFSYDAGTDLVSINNTPLVDPNANFLVSDLAYYQQRNLIIATGKSGVNPIITLVDYDNATFTPQILNSTGGSNYASSTVDEDGDIVVAYNDNSDGVSVYGKIGTDLVTNLDPLKRIGVAGESVVAGVGNTVKLLIAGSVVQAPAGVSLTPNGDVFVSELGIISSVTSSNAINIGRALSTTDYILN
jgi:hypothetical protein